MDSMPVLEQSVHLHVITWLPDGISNAAGLGTDSSVAEGVTGAGATGSLSECSSPLPLLEKAAHMRKLV
ncbi:MAG: hypothetical protein KF753_05525 [Caldilineaceae bacterium]|nr:hypothetical protein [Caldilineaceae bacterium]